MIRRARWALATMFFVNGAVVASWVPHIPAVKSRHALTDGQLGLVLLAMAAGSVVALPIAGRLVGRFGSRSMTAAAGLALCLALPLPIVSPDVIVLSLCLALLGACNGALDVSMNANALVVERYYRRSIMSSFHALWSLGGVVGAVLASGAMWFGVGDMAHVVGASAVSTLAAAAAARRLVSTCAQGDGPAAAFGRPTRALLVLGVLAFCGLLAEGAIGDWSAVYLHDSLAAGPAVAALGFGAFALAMTAGRLTGDRLVEHLGAGVVLRASSAVAAAGLGAALLIDAPLAAVVGFALVGLGIANVVPVLFGSAGKIGGPAAGSALAAVATPGYVGFLSGPPLIGLVAEQLGLRAALATVCAACALIALGAGRLPGANIPSR